MNDFDNVVLCRTVYEFYDKGEYPTASKLRKIMEEKIGFSGSQSSMLRLLRKMGFRYRRCNDGRKFLMEIYSRAFLFLDTTSFIALNDISHSDVDTGIESSNILTFYWYGVPIRFFLLVLSSKVLIFTGTVYRCVTAQLQHCLYVINYSS
jgi:hypothetical protein